MPKTKRHYFGKHSKGKKSLKTKKTLRGGYYGASGPIAPGAMQWSHGSEMGSQSASLIDRGGNGEFNGTRIDTRSLQYGSGRKGAKKGKGKKTVKRGGGGNKFGATYASFQGTGQRGIQDAVAGTHKPPQAALGDFNNKGAGPGDFSSFVSSRAY